MNKTITVNRKEINVSFSGYFDSAVGDLLFTQVMCDVFMPGNEVVPVAVEKEQIDRIIAAFKKRKALYGEIRKENVKGKSYYVINPRMRYDLEWLEGKKKVILSKDHPPRLEAVDKGAIGEEQQPQAEREPAREDFSDGRRAYLASQGFAFNRATNNWEAGGIRFPDALVNKPGTDEEFRHGMERLIAADRQSRSKKSRSQE